MKIIIIQTDLKQNILKSTILYDGDDEDDNERDENSGMP